MGGDDASVSISDEAEGDGVDWFGFGCRGGDFERDWGLPGEEGGFCC